MPDAKEQNQQCWAMLSFSLYFGWLLSFAFEGPVFYALAAGRELDTVALNLTAVFAHFAGLMTAGLFVNSLRRARQVLMLVCTGCIAGSGLFLLLPERFWLPLLTVMAFFAGWPVAAWGYYTKSFFPGIDRLRLVANILLCSYLCLVVAGLLARNVSAAAAMAFIVVGLLVSLAAAFRLSEQPIESPPNVLPGIRIIRPFFLLCLFVFVIAINAGIMYRIVYPAFPGFEELTSFYHVIPYMSAIWLLRLHADKLRHFHVLYIGLGLMGLAYAFFMLLDRSLSSYFVVNTLMLAACGVNDLFWWGILGELVSYVPNPAQLLGTGLGMNVLGVWCGGLLATHIVSAQKGSFFAAGIAFIVIFLSLFIIPVLNKKLLLLLREHVFLLRIAELTDKELTNREQTTMYAHLKTVRRLTDRELEIIHLLIKGYTYKAMAKQLFISENTLKTHVRNIYAKLEINSRMELIQLLERNMP